MFLRQSPCRRRRHVERRSIREHFDEAIALEDQVARIGEPEAEHDWSCT
jgi:hypothetical protein